MSELGLTDGAAAVVTGGAAASVRHGSSGLRPALRDVLVDATLQARSTLDGAETDVRAP